MSHNLTHLNEQGDAIMVDVSAKKESVRTARAEGNIRLNEAAFAALVSGSVNKGDALAAARIAGIMAVKKTADLIPLCHRIPIEKAAIDFDLSVAGVVRACCDVTATAKTGVEMEALCGVSAALLTIYDMAKALDRGMEIDGIRLVRKTGGRHGDYAR